MKIHCSTTGCEGMTGRLNGKCRDCKATTVVLPAVLEVAQPAPVAVVDTMPRCGCCGRVFPLLVDDILCINCDSLLFPAAVAS